MEGARGSLTNAAEVTRAQDMKIFATSHGLSLSLHEEKRTGVISCPELQAQLHAQATQGQTCPGEKQQHLSFDLRDSSVGYSKIWLPICLSCQCSTSLSHPGASEKAPVWFHVPAASL